MQIHDLLARYRQGERYFAHVDLSGASLTGVNLQDIDLTGANLTGANLSWSFLNRAQLSGAILRQADLRHITMAGAKLNGAILSGANLSKADLRLADLQEVDLNWAVLQEADLSTVNLQGAKLDQSNLERAKLNNSQLMGAQLMEANLLRASLISANLTAANLREANLDSANLRGAILIRTNLTEANLSGVCLRSANLSEADLHRVVLTGADISEAILNGADMSRANLAGAYLLKASLRKAYLLRTNLQDVLLLRADLSEANLRGADLQRSDLSGAYLSDTILSEADLSGAYLLESHLIRTNLDRVQMTGCCIESWHVEDVDLSRVECSYVFKGFDYATKNPTQRYPTNGNLKAGELAVEYSQDSSTIAIDLREPPNWQVLVFALAQLEQEIPQLSLTIKSFDTQSEYYQLQLMASQPVNVQQVRDRIVRLYPEMLSRFDSKRREIFKLLDIPLPPDEKQLAAEKSIEMQRQQKQKKRQLIYKEVVNQIDVILMSQAPEKFVESVQRLLIYLHRQGFSTEEIQQKVISSAIAKRAKRDATFTEQLLLWEKTAPESVRFSSVGSAVRLAIALLWQNE